MGTAQGANIANTAPLGPAFVSLPMDDMAVELNDKQSSDIDVVRTCTVTHAGGTSNASVPGTPSSRH